MDKQEIIINKLLIIVEKNIEKIELNNDSLTKIKIANLVFETRLTMNQIFSIIEKGNVIIELNPFINRITEFDNKLKEYELNYHSLYEICGIKPPIPKIKTKIK